MGRKRRNAISRLDAQIVGAVAAVAAVGAAFAGCASTGEPSVDVALTAVLGAAVAWAAATAPWRVLIAAASVCVVTAGASLWALLFALAALGGSAWLAVHRSSVPPLRAAIGAAIVQSALRLSLNPFTFFTAFIAAVVLFTVVWAGTRRRARNIRRRALWVVLVGGAVGLAGVAGLAGAAVAARVPAADGYRSLLKGLDEVGRGDPAAAAASLRSAVADLESAKQDLDAVWAQPARLIPVLAPNRGAAVGLLGAAASAATSAAEALDVVDLDQLRVVNGTIDLDAVAVLATPLATLDATVHALKEQLDSVRSPWLFGPMADRISSARRRAEKVGQQAHGAAMAARVAPSLLGADGPRRYLIAFTSPAESRSTSGVMGNWAELSVDEGSIELVNRGRTSDITSAMTAGGPFRFVDASDELIERFGGVGAGSRTEPVDPRYWSNVTMSPDMPTVASQMAAMYEHATLHRVDGVFVLDPAAIAGLLQVIGPVRLPEASITLEAATAEQFLLREQYSESTGDRVDLLAEATDATVDQLLSSTLPGPQVIAAKLGPVALAGHLSAWASLAAEQELLETVGIDGGLPLLRDGDGLGVTLDNAAGNKIDSFVRTTVSYRGTVGDDGTVRSTAVITLTNTAPTSGYPDYVIGNLVGLPKGTARMRVSVLSALRFVSAELDGTSVGLSAQTERGWNVMYRTLELGPGESAELTVELGGTLAADGYSLVVKPPALADPVDWHVEMRSPDGADLASLDGVVTRRTVVSAAGASAFRP